MVGEPALDLPLDALPRSSLVADVVYIPRETPLLAAARTRGNRTVNGLGMLLHQARPAFHGWFGIMPEVTPELRALIEATLYGSRCIRAESPNADNVIDFKNLELLFAKNRFPLFRSVL